VCECCDETVGKDPLELKRDQRMLSFKYKVNCNGVWLFGYWAIAAVAELGLF
jgi:hypothetical protein